MKGIANGLFRRALTTSATPPQFPEIQNRQSGDTSRARGSEIRWVCLDIGLQRLMGIRYMQSTRPTKIEIRRGDDR